ncbi:hypothetical protein ACFVGY_20030 [Streptomyces sp. NPDC127106]|uniref:hypothetical protein n=1 Tax=Streptomyces sp. NPDC127106 TaxID=3345360 RepID=UPI00364210F4
MAKIVFTLLWAAVLIVVNQVLHGNVWGQYLSTFLLGGIYALALAKVEFLRGKKVDEASK